MLNVLLKSGIPYLYSDHSNRAWIVEIVGFNCSGKFWIMAVPVVTEDLSSMES